MRPLILGYIVCLNRKIATITFFNTFLIHFGENQSFNRKQTERNLKIRGSESEIYQYKHILNVNNYKLYICIY